MIKILSSLILSSLFIISYSPDARADEIRLKDGTIITGKIIQVTTRNIEYNPDGPRPFELIERDMVVEIIYSDGLRVNLTESDEEKSGRGGTFIDKSADEEQAEKDKTVIKPGTEQAVRRRVKIRDFLEFELGWNSYVGSGIRFERHLFDGFTLNIGGGYSVFWSYRFSGGLRYYLKYPFGLAFGLGASYNPGISDYRADMETRDSLGNENPQDEQVIFELSPVTVLNLTVLYSWRVFSTHRIYVETGYSIRLTDDYYRIKNDKILTPDSEDIVNLSAPGGGIFSVGYAIAI